MNDKVTIKEIVDFCRLTFVGHAYGQALANRIEAHGIEQPSIDALIADIDFIIDNAEAFGDTVDPQDIKNAMTKYRGQK